MTLTTPLRLFTRTLAGSLGGPLLAATLVGCGGDDDDGADGGSGSIGTVSDQEFGGHKLREIPSDGAPAVELDVSADDHGGFNVHLLTERFVFAPENVNGTARPGEGHTHLYLDDTKYTRIYDNLPEGAVAAGEHALLVTLNANDHTVWATNANAITASAMVTGGMSDHEHAHNDADSPAAPDDSADHDHTESMAADAQVIEITISGGEVSPAPGRVKVAAGATVHLVVHSDEPDEVHLHGYDLATGIGPEQDGAIEFVADQTGLFEVETHESELILTQLLVR